MSSEERTAVPLTRLYAFLLVFALCSVALVARAVNLQVMESEFLQGQGEARFMREVEVPTRRGNILDRSGEPLAVSTPVDSVWAHPGELLQTPEDIAPLAAILGADADEIERRLNQRSGRSFVWLRRRLHPDVAEEIRAADLDGVYLQKEYRRFYPAGEVAAHVIGFTNIDDIGQEGLELAYNDWLQGKPGRKRVIRDRLGRTVEHVELLREAEHGHDLALTIDRRLQYLAYRELKRTVLKHGARSGSIVLLDIPSGEVLAMVNQPSFNPNQPNIDSDGLRNRAVTDVFEPGSVMKPFAVAAALEAGIVRPDTPIDTTPGTINISGHTISDHRNYGPIDVTRVITKSSNVGATKLALAMEAEQLWSVYDRFGYGDVTGIGFPGESAGVLRNHRRWRRVEQATLSYGYGLSVTTLQLASAFAALADEGRMRPPSLIQGATNPAVSVLDPEIARQVAAMMETVTGPDGTGKAARVTNYRVSGKTGTSRKASAAGYASRYVSTFAGFAPSSEPRLVCVVVINDPSNGQYYGGAVAAPLFSTVMAGALRLLDIPPDDFAGTLVDHAESQRTRAGGEAP
ncbi:peptidoglycan D,D-transpeptidase FtsI family protein [Elongatibacter sediminis]|uniref:Peptidoglycan D,D-transpeptidase FtsI n=1 Tax=Elongatibacter sediminis TaxID=3119006 RepID=A0AAW9R9A0_9GAMM